uniref:Uncharacterized protein n=1 Tax=Fagus sylvatica TaxID=28930 RepID=A0A2N9JA42_FAGSY
MGRTITRTHNSWTRRCDGSRRFPFIKSPLQKAVGGIRTPAHVPSSSADAIEAKAPSQAVGEDAVDQAEAARNGGVNPAQAAGLVIVHHMEWAEIVIAACWASAIDIALQSVQ